MPASDLGTGTIYLLHFDRPYKHARHYLGWAKRGDGQRAIRRHLRGISGVRLADAACAAGITMRVARTWPDMTQTDERQMHAAGNQSRLCTICRRERQAAAQDAHLEQLLRASIRQAEWRRRGYATRKAREQKQRS